MQREERLIYLHRHEMATLASLVPRCDFGCNCATFRSYHIHNNHVALAALRSPRYLCSSLNSLRPSSEIHVADIVFVNPRFEASYWGLENALPIFGKKA